MQRCKRYYDDQESVLFCAAPVEEVEAFVPKVHVPT